MLFAVSDKTLDDSLSLDIPERCLLSVLEYVNAVSMGIKEVEITSMKIIFTMCV
jgi:hypothetical protein